jgi:hypothetical protein
MRVHSIEKTMITIGQWAGRHATVLTLRNDAVEEPLSGVIDRLDDELSLPYQLVITGDEPVLQAQELGVILKHLLARHPGLRVLAQVTGTRIPDLNFRSYMQAWDVTLPANDPEEWVMDDALLYYARTPSAMFCWTVNNQGHIDTAFSTAKRLGIGPDRVLLQPSLSHDNLSVVHQIVRACNTTGANMGVPVYCRIPSPEQEQIIKQRSGTHADSE